MDSLLFLSVLVGTAWLCIWVLQDPRRPNRPWSPFDARQFDRDAGDAPKPSGRRAGPLPRAWQQRGGARTGIIRGPAPEPPPWRRRSGS